MCGISGILGTTASPPIGAGAIHAMISQMVHRGPDGEGIWISDDARVALGHRRLAILDLSENGRQPMSGRSPNVQVTFNGEIYNHKELRGELISRGHQFRSKTDTEVIVRLYEELGDQMIERLDGDFAFGIWDGQRRRLLLARDRAGVKPLYYFRSHTQFYFASEIKALLALAAVPREINDESLYHYLTYLFVPPPHTLFRGICKLPAAGVLTLELKDDDLKVQLSRFWEPLAGQCELNESALDEQLRALFEQSVEKRLMSDVPVGVLFSGGVDSTLNAASFARSVAPRPVKTFNVGVEGTRLFRDESAFATEMAATLGTEHHRVTIGEQDLIAATSDIARHQDEPLADPVCVPLYFVTRLAREAGVTVLHGGEGADEVFGGYDKYRRFSGFYSRVWSPLAKLPRPLLRLGHAALRRGRAYRLRKAADCFYRLSRGQEFLLSSSVAYYEQEKQAILSRDFGRRSCSLDSFDVVADLYRRLRRDHPDASFFQQVSFLELQLRLPELLLMRVDKMSMMNSVEVRVPFLDRDLVDFALAAPDSFKLRNGVGKEPLKRLASSFVAPEQVYRPKSGFGAPIQDWFASRLGQEMRDQLESDRDTLASWFDVDELRRRLQRRPRTTNDAFQLWVVYNFMQWRRSFFDDSLRAAA